MTPHIMTVLENIFCSKERKLIHEQLMKSLMGHPDYPMAVVWIKEDGEVLEALGGAAKRLGIREKKGERYNVYEIYPHLRPHIVQCLEGNEPVYFDWVGEGITGQGDT